MWATYPGPVTKMRYQALSLHSICFFNFSGYAIADTSGSEQHLTSELSSSLGLVPHQVI